MKFPVGEWATQSHLKWIWFYCKETDRVIQKKENEYVTYRRSTNATRNNPVYITSGGIIPLPPNLLHTSVTILSPTLIKFEGTANECQTTNLPSSNSNLPPSVTKNKQIFWTLTHSNVTSQVGSKWIEDGLKEGNLRAVCDGSYKHKLTKKGISASWVIESNDKKNQMTGICCTENKRGDAYRAELLGIYALLNAIYFVEQSLPHIMNGDINISCDNEKNRIQSMIDDEKVQITNKHMDLVKAIRKMRRLLRTNINILHIYMVTKMKQSHIKS